jgi:hypothetical protein
MAIVSLVLGFGTSFLLSGTSQPTKQPSGIHACYSPQVSCVFLETCNQTWQMCSVFLPIIMTADLLKRDRDMVRVRRRDTLQYLVVRKGF